MFERSMMGVAALVVACGGSDDRGGSSAGIATITATLGEQTSGATEATGESGEGPLDEGPSVECENDDDCPAGQHCGEGSQTCLDPDGCVFDMDCDEGFVCEDDVCSIGGDCGGFQFELEQTPPNMMILLDRSGSMDGEVDGTGLNRWEVATSAIFQVTTEFDEEIRFGLTTYSSCAPGGCSAGSTEVPIAPMNAAPIQAFLNTTVGVGSNDGQQVDGAGKIQYLCDSGDPETSTGVSLAGLVGDPSLLDPMRPNVVLLLTDGGESDECTDVVNGPGGALMLYSQDPQVRVFAVGTGDASVDQLTDIAIAGGTDVPYFADQPADLQMALAEIAGSVASCTFTLDQVPPDASMIYVFFDLDPAGVPNDEDNGWTYDPATNSITFHGQACADLQAGAVVDVDIVYGCNSPPAG